MMVGWGEIMSSKMEIISLNIGKPKNIMANNKEFVSSVGRERVSKAYLTKQGFEGDSVQYKDHGGPDRAVLFYCHEHYEKWNAEYNKKLLIPGFGENITVSNLSEDYVKIGDVFKIGETLVEISQPRIPCSNLSNYNEESSLLKRLVNTGYTGYLGRVLEQGWIHSDSTIEIISRLPGSVTIKEANTIFFHEKENKSGIKTLLSIPALAEEWKSILRRRLATIE
jgi:MOSC domain-containing protein YiiM